MSWGFAPAFDAAHRAALAARKNLVYVCPPAAWAAAPLFGQLGDTDPGAVRTLVLAPDPATADDLASTLATLPALCPVHGVSGVARAARHLRSGWVRTLVAMTADALELIARSSLDARGLASVAVAWPELHLSAGFGEGLDTALAECGGIGRLVLTSDDAAIGDFLERHARRAPVAVAARAGTPVGAARYAVVPKERLAWAVRAVLDSLNPDSVLLWDPSPLAAERWTEHRDDPTVRVAADPGGEPVSLAVAVELPTPEALFALRAAARDVIVLVRAAQLAYLQRLAHPLKAMRLPSEADRARDRSFGLRSKLRERLADGAITDQLMALAPLLDEYDPAVVAAAALVLSTGAEAAGPASGAAHTTAAPTWVHLRLNVGRRDRVRTADVVGALLNGVGLPKDHVGRVEVRESFTLVEVRADAADRALLGLADIQLRGRAVGAHIDRH